MNALLIVLAALLLSGNKFSEIKNVLKTIDFASFKPILSVLGLNGKIIDFICSEEFSAFLDGDGDLSKIPALLSGIMPAAEKDVKSETAEEKDCGLDPIKPVAPSEIEESLGSYFN